MIDGIYNDPEYLCYEGEKWTFDKLKTKAESLNIPKFSGRSKASYSYLIRVVEQLNKIEYIIKPNYPNGYETEEMSDDSEWLP